MGPGDPFGRPKSAQQPQPTVNVQQPTFTPPESKASFDTYMHSGTSRHPNTLSSLSLHRASVSVLLGVLGGAVLGIVALFASWQGVLLILAMSAFGGLIAWGIWAIVHSQLQFGEAWRVLRSKPPR